ncbi:MAG: hypothetical protein M0T85_07395 [Dehalococcoidales bacterium]|nr:hypothetical protein [Dehalococcoidales bacterium]
MPSKITVATRSLQSCFGCHISVLELHEELFEALEAIDFVSWPLNDVKAIPDVDVAIVEGSVGNSNDEMVLRELRARSQVLIALGTCACFGGVPGLRNLHKAEDVLSTTFLEGVGTVDGHIPASNDLPHFLPHVQTVDQIVEVNYHLPGCPPLPSVIKDALSAISRGEQPVLPTRSLCAECAREQTELLVPQREFVTDTVRAPMELDQIDSKKCFLEQGVLCMGPATREGCKSRCLNGNLPCRGCMGPTPDALEQGAKIVNAMASLLPAGGLMFLEDIVGTGYRYSLPVSIVPYIVDN